MPSSMNPHLLSLSLLLLLLLLSTKNFVKATEFTVGDDGGWAQGINYLSWSEKYNFTVGDILVFSYVKSQHNVYEVTEGTYRSCDSSSGMKAIYDTGNDRVALAEPRQYWFICDTSGHCKGGMKFSIKVDKLSPEISPAPPPPVRDEGQREWRTNWGWGILVLLSFFVSGI